MLSVGTERRIFGVKPGDKYSNR